MRHALLYVGFGLGLLLVSGLRADDEKSAAPAEKAPASAPSEDAPAEDPSASAEDAPNDAAAHAAGEASTEEAHPHQEGAEHDDHHAGGGGHHDETDLSHANAGPELTSPSQLKSDLALWTFVVFLCLLGVLSWQAWGPVMDGLEQREQSIANLIEDAEKNATQAQLQLQQYEAKLAAAGEEAREILAQARRDAETAGERIVAEAQDAAQRERERAVADVTQAKNSALQEITERSVDLAVAMAGRLVQRQMTADDRAGLIREALDQLPSEN